MSRKNELFFPKEGLNRLHTNPNFENILNSLINNAGDNKIEEYMNFSKGIEESLINNKISIEEIDNLISEIFKKLKKYNTSEVDKFFLSWIALIINNYLIEKGFSEAGIEKIKELSKIVVTKEIESEDPEDLLKTLLSLLQKIHSKNLIEKPNLIKIKIDLLRIYQVFNFYFLKQNIKKLSTSAKIDKITNLLKNYTDKYLNLLSELSSEDISKNIELFRHLCTNLSFLNYYYIILKIILNANELNVSKDIIENYEKLLKKFENLYIDLKKNEEILNKLPFRTIVVIIGILKIISVINKSNVNDLIGTILDKYKIQLKDCYEKECLEIKFLKFYAGIEIKFIGNKIEIQESTYPSLNKMMSQNQKEIITSLSFLKKIPVRNIQNFCEILATLFKNTNNLSNEHSVFLEKYRRNLQNKVLSHSEDISYNNILNILSKILGALLNLPNLSPENIKLYIENNEDLNNENIKPLGKTEQLNIPFKKNGNKIKGTYIKITNNTTTIFLYNMSSDRKYVLEIDLPIILKQEDLYQLIKNFESYIFNFIDFLLNKISKITYRTAKELKENLNGKNFIIIIPPNGQISGLTEQPHSLKVIKGNFEIPKDTIITSYGIDFRNGQLKNQFPEPVFIQNGTLQNRIIINEEAIVNGTIIVCKNGTFYIPNEIKDGYCQLLPYDKKKQKYNLPHFICKTFLPLKIDGSINISDSKIESKTNKLKIAGTIKNSQINGDKIHIKTVKPNCSIKGSTILIEEIKSNDSLSSSNNIYTINYISGEYISIQKIDSPNNIINAKYLKIRELNHSKNILIVRSGLFIEIPTENIIHIIYPDDSKLNNKIKLPTGQKYRILYLPSREFEELITKHSSSAYNAFKNLLRRIERQEIQIFK